MSQSNISVSEIITEIRRQLDAALAIAKAAEVCALDGHIDRAFHISLDMEDLLHSTNNLLQAASAINRMQQKETSH